MSARKLKTQMRMMSDCNQKGYLRKPHPKDAGEMGKSDTSQDYGSGSSYACLHVENDPLVKKITALDLEKEATTHHEDPMFYYDIAIKLKI